MRTTAFLAGQRRIVAELDALRAQVGALKRLQAWTAEGQKLKLRPVCIRFWRGKKLKRGNENDHRTKIRHLIRPAATFSPFEAEQGSHPRPRLPQPTGLTESPVKHSLTAWSKPFPRLATRKG